MSDAPMSRRARRTSEEEAADRAASNDPTLAFARAIATGEVPAIGPEGEALSRRDRRRLERLARPLEAWTAEEEMLVTGQIPAMTPERIAEQERLSRKKAEAAAAEAEAASQEFKMLASAELPRVYSAEPAPVAAPAPEPQPEPVPAPVVAPAAAPEPAPASADVPRRGLEPYQPRVVLDESLAAPPAAPVPAAPEPVVPVADAPEPFPAPSEPFPVPPSPVPADDARARVLDELFPPGSSQAALRQQDPFSSPAQPLPSESIPVLSPPLPVASPRDGVDEIRRLAAEAISGIERAARPGEGADEQSAPPAQPPVAVPWNQVGPAAEPTPAAPIHEAPAHEEPVHEPASEATQLAPHHAMFDQIARTPSGGLSVQQVQPAQGAPGSGAFPTVASGAFPTVASGDARQPAPMFPPVTTGSIPLQGQPAASPFPGDPQGPAWAAHPLEAVQAPVGAGDVNDFQPVADVPRPDFSTFTQPTPVSPFPSVGGMNTGDATSTGQITPIRRLEPPPVGGAKHFQWLHLAVIGALMFVLGVVIYHVAFGQ